MKEKIIITIVLSIFFLFALFIWILPTSQYVKLQDNSFYLNNKPFYPKVLNYLVSTQCNTKEIWPCAYMGYDSVQVIDKYTVYGKFKYTTKNASLKELENNMKLIKKLGFNTVRIVGIGEYNFDEKDNGKLSINSHIKNEKDTLFFMDNKESRKKYLTCVNTLLNIINKAGLKTILLLRNLPDYNSTDTMLAIFAQNFRNNTGLFAYDLFNEPLYQDLKRRPKKEVYAIVNRWNSIIRVYDKNHLTTIGLEGVREVFEWDPNILNVNFISYHPYEYEPNQVINEIYWYGKYTKKPWIIGETAMPADNDSITYTQQTQFAKKVMTQAHNCGASGFSWWQFKDVEWLNYHANFMGIINRNGQIKPVANAIKKFNFTNSTKTECLRLKNYYNYSNCTSFYLKGKLVDENSNPIEGGVIMAWSKDWLKSYHTISKKDGSFNLWSNYPFYHWIISATERNTLVGEIDTLSIQNDSNNIPFVSLGKHILKKLPF